MSLKNDPQQFHVVLSDKTTKPGMPVRILKPGRLGISVPMPGELCQLIPIVFWHAYQLSILMKFISEASVTLSEQGTVNLFCNDEGGFYYGFLVEEFQRELSKFIEILSNFSEQGMAYAHAQYTQTSKKMGKSDPLGQYLRIGRKYKSIKESSELLGNALRDTLQKIEEFRNINPDASLRKKEVLYDAIRGLMRIKNQPHLAEQALALSVKYKSSVQLELIEEEKGSEEESGDENKQDAPESPDSYILIPLLSPQDEPKPLPRQAETDRGLLRQMEEKMREGGGYTVFSILEDEYHHASSPPSSPEGKAFPGTPAYQERLTKKRREILLRVVGNMDQVKAYCQPTFLIMLFRLRSSLKSYYAHEFLKVLIAGSEYLKQNQVRPGTPLVESQRIEQEQLLTGMPLFYGLLSDFIQSVEAAKFTNEIFYRLARELRSTLDSPEFRFLVFNAANEVEKLRGVLSEVQRELAQSRTTVQQMADRLAEKDTALRNGDSERAELIRQGQVREAVLVREKAEAEAEVGALRKEVVDAQEQLAYMPAMKLEIGALRGKLAEKNTEVEALIVERAATNQRIAKMETQIDEMSRETLKGEQKMGEMGREARENKQEITEMRQMMAKMQSQIDSFTYTTQRQGAASSARRPPARAPSSSFEANRDADDVVRTITGAGFF